jgi:hypothetical protein
MIRDVYPGSRIRFFPFRIPDLGSGSGTPLVRRDRVEVCGLSRCTIHKSAKVLFLPSYVSKIISTLIIIRERVPVPRNQDPETNSTRVASPPVDFGPDTDLDLDSELN